MAGGGRGVKAILNEFSLPAKCELMIRSLTPRTRTFIHSFTERSGLWPWVIVDIARRLWHTGDSQSIFVCCRYGCQISWLSTWSTHLCRNCKFRKFPFFSTEPYFVLLVRNLPKVKELSGKGWENICVELCFIPSSKVRKVVMKKWVKTGDRVVWCAMAVCCWLHLCMLSHLL